jgi:hypothetical protein
MERDEVEAAIRDAFAGVRLGSGLSLRQSVAADTLGAGLTRAEFDRLPESEVTDDWTRVPEADMRRAALGYLDRDGLRYYLPALMLWLLGRYDDQDGRLFDSDYDVALIGTLSWIVPGKDFRVHHYAIFDTFSEAQREAIAAYVEALPRLVNLRWGDPVLVERSIRDYWGRFLPKPG